MEKTLDTREVTIVVLARNHNPTILNPDFLSRHAIVPEDWELGEPPICADPFAQVKYRNGFAITAQLDRVTFTETLVGKRIEESLVADVATRYLKTLPHVDYRAIGINPQGHVLAETLEEARYFTLDHLIAPGPWTFLNDTKPLVAVSLKYPFEKAQVTIKIEEASWKPDDTGSVPVAYFGANFHREVAAEEAGERLARISEILAGVTTDCHVFKRIVEEVFLAGKRE